MLPIQKYPCAISAGLIYRYALGLRLEANIGSLQDCDSILKNDQSEGKYRYQRNLSFRSSISEIILLAELYPIRLFAPAEEDTRKHRLCTLYYRGNRFVPL